MSQVSEENIGIAITKHSFCIILKKNRDPIGSGKLHDPPIGSGKNRDPLFVAFVGNLKLPIQNSYVNLIFVFHIFLPNVSDR